MDVSLIALRLSPGEMAQHFVAQARAFRAHGDQVHLLLGEGRQNLPDDLGERLVAGAEPPSSDLLIYHLVGDALPPSLRQQTRGVVFVHDHGQKTDGGDSLAAHYADLCLVSDEVRRQELLAEYSLPPERVHLLPELDQEMAYCSAFLEFVDRALADDWPPAPRLPVEGAMNQIESKTPTTPASPGASLALARSQADVMPRDYQVRSRIPLLGGLVAWLRRNLTSHLREPYLDPTLERQVAFNRTVVDWMEGVEGRLAAMAAQIEQLQTREAKIPTSNEKEPDAG
jgi:hypothetical protein